MMAETRMLGRDMQEEILKGIRRSQEFVLDAIKTWAGAVQPVAPKLPLKQLPLMDKLPKPEVVVEETYDFAEKLLASQRKFAEEILKATAPYMPGKSNEPGTGTPPANGVSSHPAKPRTSKPTSK